LNYAVALIGLALIGLIWQTQRRAEQPLRLIEPAGMQPVSDATGPDQDNDQEEGGA
jgi:hypothetical protein